MLLSCTNKGCLQATNAKLDVDSNEVFCQECGKTINVTPFAKKALKDAGQIIRHAERKPFSLLCSKCNKKRTVYMKDDMVYCEYCHEKIPVSAHFKIALREHLENNE